MEHAFDIVVIGTGVGGSSVAYKCQSAGWKVAIVDSRPFGGTCVLRGCDPKKVLVGAADAHDWNVRMRERGIFRHATGAPVRFPEPTGKIEDLALDRAGIAHDRNGVTVNDYLQSTTNPAVYAPGDAAGTPGMPLTPVASMEAEVAAENLLHGNRRKPIYEGIPTVVFTDPPLASVGMREDEAAAQKLKFHVQDQDTSQWYSSRRLGISRSGSRILTEDETDRILGAHLFGPNAEEVVNLFGLAIRSGLTAAALRQMVYSYPSSCSDIPSML